MRSALACMLLVGCTDAAEVPTTVVHIQLSARCTMPDCSPYSEVFYDHCGPSGSTAITATTRDVEVLTNYDANDIAAYVQLQYTSDPSPPGARELVYLDHLLTAGADVEVYAAYDYKQLYRIVSSGEVVDIDTTTLTAATGTTLQFQYTAYGIAVQEDHVIDAPVPVRVETDSPGITDACCSIARPPEAGLVLLALGVGLRRRRRAAQLNSR